ncbi:uncharacterized protein LOC117649814 isoform X2 [Thrips palmi]|uniref:Uncharacterized protein LOC117649814 isoform X2 n=1 Tax=Thrips palmi TaxID=161013 RepID=A0A6P8ZV13_THRPL|nr:uncharacterized protein LOC117649814 isoform X2 [Thrips palmi]
MEDRVVQNTKMKKDRHNCCVPQCSAVKSANNHLHQVPKEEGLRKAWAIAIKTGKSLNPKMTVCSKHFLDTDYIISLGAGLKRRLKPGIIPSQNLPNRVHDKVVSSPVKRKRQERVERVAKRRSREIDGKAVEKAASGLGCASIAQQL